MSTDQDDPFSSKPSRAQPQTGLPSDGTKTPGGRTASSGDEHAAPEPPPTGPPTAPPGAEEQAAPQPPPTGPPTAPPDGPPGGSGEKGEERTPETPGDSEYRVVDSGTGSAPPPSGSPYDTAGAPGAADAAGASNASNASNASGGPAEGSGATPPPPSGSPYDTPASGGTPPPAPPPPGYGGGGEVGGEGGGVAGSAYGVQDPRLAGMPPLAGLGRRLLARIIDALIIYIPVSVIVSVFGTIGDIGDSDNAGPSYGWSLLGIAAYLVYEGLMLTRSGQTVGKRLMNIRVGMLENGAVPAGNPGWIRAAVYSLPGLVPCLGTLFWLYNVLSCTWDKPYRQAVHDKAAKTVVVSAEGPRLTP